ncbi:hypothetical protein Anas_11104 [Armadillidium nasatum]|uniref:Uncharacterized protein n=1 Tax=Armadillidium nasatum TaxID=96803 RepID=A0A5N5SVK8_9CRUS|nr:hypothetical protein Anas_11104 [Armadillidium nasatum]
MKYLPFLPLAFPDCYVIMGGCPENYEPPPSCLFKRCPPGSYCCFDGCYYTCSLLKYFSVVDPWPNKNIKVKELKYKKKVTYVRKCSSALHVH